MLWPGMAGSDSETASDVTLRHDTFAADGCVAFCQNPVDQLMMQSSVLLFPPCPGRAGLGLELSHPQFQLTRSQSRAPHRRQLNSFGKEVQSGRPPPTLVIQLRLELRLALILISLCGYLRSGDCVLRE